MAAFVLMDSRSEQGPYHEDEGEQATQAQAAAKAAIEQPAVADMLGTEDASKSHDRQKADVGEHRAEEGFGAWLFAPQAGDTLAQWLMMFASVAATGISVAAVVLLKRTLDATREAVKEAGDATEAAQAVVAVTEKAAEIQLRAYVCLKEVRVEWADLLVRLTAVAHNHGATPAYALGCFSGTVMTNAGQAFRVNWQTPGERSLNEHIIGPGAECNVSYDVFMDETEYNGLERGDLALYCYGEFFYRDAFGQQRYTRFRHMIGGDEGVDVAYMSPCAEDNEAN